MKKMNKLQQSVCCSTIVFSIFASAVTAPTLALAKETTAHTTKAKTSTSKRKPAASEGEIAKAEAFMREQLRLAATLSVVDETYLSEFKDKVAEILARKAGKFDNITATGVASAATGAVVGMTGVVLSMEGGSKGDQGLEKSGERLFVGGGILMVAGLLAASTSSMKGVFGANKIKPEELNNALQQNVDQVTDFYGYVFSLDESKKSSLKAALLNAVIAQANSATAVNLQDVLMKEVGVNAGQARAVETVAEAIKFGTLESGGSNVASLSAQERTTLAKQVIQGQTDVIDAKVADLIKNRASYEGRGINVEQMKTNLINVQKKLNWVSKNL